MSKPKYLVNGPRVFRNNKAQFVRAWKSKREFIVQIWAGEPPADWAFDTIIGLQASIDTAYLQTKWDK